MQFEPRLIPDEQASISAALIELVDAGCALVLTTSGTGPALHDVTPEVTLAGGAQGIARFWRANAENQPEICAHGYFVRQVAVIRSKTLIINLPGQH